MWDELLFKSQRLTARTMAQRATLRHIMTSGYYVIHLKEAHSSHGAPAVSHSSTLLREMRVPLGFRSAIPRPSNFKFRIHTVNCPRDLSHCSIVSASACFVLSFKMQIPTTLTSLLQRNPWRPSESVDWHPLIIVTETWPSDCCYEHAAGGSGGRGLYGAIVPFYNETYLNRFRIRRVQCLCVFNVTKLLCLISV